MGSPSLQLRRHVLAWDRPLLRQAADFLAAEWDGNAALDLSGTWVVVPTRHSGRRLREALAELAAAKKQAVFAPRVHTPDSLLAQAEAHSGVAKRLEALLAWTQALREAELDALPALFPVAPPARDFAWAWRLAQRFFALQTQLAESGLSCADVVSRAGPNFPEANRWRELADLEEKQRELLTASGRREPHEARRDYAAHAPVPAGIGRIVLLATPDPLPLALSLLERWADSVPVDVVLFCAAEDVNAFDRWGRPDPTQWQHRALALPDFESAVHLCATPEVEARRTAAIAAQYGTSADEIVGVGMADGEVLSLMENELRRVRLRGYNPEGRPRHQERLYTLLVALAAFARDPSIAALSTLARCPDFLAALGQRLGRAGSAAQWLQNLDTLRTTYLPADLAAAKRHATAGGALAEGFAFLAELHDALISGPFPGNAVRALELLFRDRRFDPANEADLQKAAAIEAWRGIMFEVQEALRRFVQVDPGDAWDIAVQAFAATRGLEEKSERALDLQGWLELLWEDAPHLVIAGLNDGLVPDAVVGDAFLPETLRRTLGLKTNNARFARDAYLLDALVASRRETGRVDLLCAKASVGGDPLRPSRLLLRCAEAELPRRVNFLFRNVESARATLPWTRAWQLRPPPVPPPARVAVTGLRAWLACPFRFYLSHVLRLEPVDAAKAELDARDFGTLCHAALEAMARESALRDCTDASPLREFLLATFDRDARARFGTELALPLVMQLEAARQRLSKAAEVQAAERSQGWVIERAEVEFALDVSGLQVRGKIDRIDRHEQTGQWRVLDYKTADLFSPPQQTHLRLLRSGEGNAPPWMQVEVDGRMLRWTDLQLPLYVRAAAALNGGEPACAGYFNLPKAVGETAVSVWHELTPGVLESATACAAGAAAAIRAGEFWPPLELPPGRDPFATLFHHGAAESVAWPPAQDSRAGQSETKAGR